MSELFHGCNHSHLCIKERRRDDENTEWKRTVEGALRCVHTLEVFFKILAGKVRRQGNDLLDAL